MVLFFSCTLWGFPKTFLSCLFFRRRVALSTHRPCPLRITFPALNEEGVTLKASSSSVPPLTKQNKTHISKGTLNTGLLWFVLGISVFGLWPIYLDVRVAASQGLYPKNPVLIFMGPQYGVVFAAERLTPLLFWEFLLKEREKSLWSLIFPSPCWEPADPLSPPLALFQLLQSLETGLQGGGKSGQGIAPFPLGSHVSMCSHSVQKGSPVRMEAQPVSQVRVGSFSS